MDAINAIYGRRSIRDYADAPPPQALIRQVITDAVQAPNSLNRQAWTFTVMMDRDRLTGISQAAKRFALDGGLGAIPDHLRTLLTSPTFNIFYNAPALIVITATSPDAMVIHDCCLAAQTLMLSAHRHGLGTCWIGFAEAWLATPEARDHLGVGPDQIPVAPIIIGTPKTVPDSPGRKSPEIHWLGEVEA